MGKKKPRKSETDKTENTGDDSPNPLSAHPIPDAWDHLGPEAWPDFHICDDFLTPLADAVAGWQGSNADKVEDVELLLGRLNLYEVPEKLGKQWLEANKPEVGKKFESERVQVVDAGRALLNELKGLAPGSEDWRNAFISFGMNVAQSFVEYLRGLSVVLRQGLPLPTPPTGDNWITVSDAARISDANKGTISRAVKAGKIKTNGKSGRVRRLDTGSFSQWVLQRSDTVPKSLADSEEVIRQAKEARRKQGFRDKD
jgi:hypothetical protein